MASSSRSVRRRVPLRALLLGALLGPALVGCSTAAATTDADAPASAPTAAPSTPGELHMAVVGDSLTAGNGLVEQPTGLADSPQRPTDMSWLLGVEGAPLVVDGGWAVPGATSVQMDEHVTRYAADVVVIMAGTNDLLKGVAWPDTRRSLLSIVEKAGVDRVVLTAVPPLDAQPTATGPLNDRLAGLAADQGWEFVDPWTDVEQDGVYRPGDSADGVHPVSTVAVAVGRAIRAQLLDGAGG